MQFKIARLRMWLAGGAVACALTVAGTYFYARHRLRSGLKQVPEKIGIEFKQTAQGFSVSKSRQGHTLFKIEARQVEQFKLGERVELKDVQITLYGRDAGRFDQIRGADFEYDQRSGDVTAKGAVEINLEENPGGRTGADQAAPSGTKNSIHLTTTGLRFNQKTGDASTDERVDFQLPQASGSAVGISYLSDTGIMVLRSQVRVGFTGANPATVRAERGEISKEPREVRLEHVALSTGGQAGEADVATLFLSELNDVQRVLATGHVRVKAGGANFPGTEASGIHAHGTHSSESPYKPRFHEPQAMETQADRLEIFMAAAPARDVVTKAVFSGNVHAESTGVQPVRGDAERAVMTFVSRNVLTQVHAEGNVKLKQPQSAERASGTAQDMELDAPVVDFFVAEGRKLQRAETAGAAQVLIRPVDAMARGQQTRITAEKFEAKFDDEGRLVSAQGAPQARVVSSVQGEPDRVSTSAALDLGFHPGDGIESIVQRGNFQYQDGERRAWADRARYTPADQVLLLTGAPRVMDRGMTTTARTMKLNRATGDALAEDDVKSTYSDLKPQPGGALLASGDPIHVTAGRMMAHRSPSIATYTGSARLWQNANVIAAPSIEFNREARSVDADGNAQQAVSTVLVQSDKAGRTTSVTITAAHFLYTDGERKAHYSGGVEARGLDAMITARQVDAYLQARGKFAATQPAGTGKIERMVADGQVVITQPERHGNGDHLVYTTADDQFVLTGGPPSIFDAEHGKVTGVSLTLFRHDDRVLVEGNDTFPASTETKVAR